MTTTQRDKLTQLIQNNMWGLRCDKCEGGGWDYEKDNRCKQCGGCGIYDWRIEPLISEFDKELQAIKAAVISEVVEKIEGNKLLSIAKYGNMPAPHDQTYKEGYNAALDHLKEQVGGKV